MRLKFNFSTSGVRVSIDLSTPTERVKPGYAVADWVGRPGNHASPSRIAELRAKRVLDYSVAAFALVFLAPLMGLIAALIKLESRGPVLFRQPRRGLNNDAFTLFKFRSMYAHFTDIEATRQTSRNDPRVTPLGRWLRRLSLDELPQLFNVLRGEMSLVGPRPHAPNMRVQGQLPSMAEPDYLLRYCVKPGITGWAQVNGMRGGLQTLEDLRRRLEMDLAYIRSWSFMLDCKIILLTLIREIISRNAF